MGIMAQIGGRPLGVGGLEDHYGPSVWVIRTFHAHPGGAGGVKRGTS